jgi:glyoxylase I family protein
MHHVSLIVADTSRALGFYVDCLGMQVDPARPKLDFPGCWLEADGLQVHLLELENPDPVEHRPAHGGRDRHTAVMVDDLDAFAARLEAAGIACTMSRSGRRALFCRDPDGNAWELIESSKNNRAGD